MDGGSPVARARHSHRRPPQRGGWQVKALACTAAAAVVITGATALIGTFSGGGHSGQPGHSAGTTSAPTRPGGTGGLNGLEGSATKEATARPTPSAAGGQQPADGPGAESGPGALCRQYLAFYARPESRADRAAASDSFKQLSDLAGGPGNIGYYCTQFQPWSAVPQGPGLSGEQGFPPPGDSQGAQRAQNPQGPQGQSGLVQHGGNGNGPGGNIPGPRGRS